MSKIHKRIRPKNTALSFAIEFTVAWIVFGLLAYTIHEYSHLLMIELLGGKAHITGWNVTTPVVLPTFKYAKPLIALAGGWGVMLVYSLLLFIIDDLQEKCALSVLTIQQGIYGIGEMFSHVGLPIDMVGVAFFGFLLGMMPSIIIMFRLFGHKRRLVQKCELVYA